MKARKRITAAVMSGIMATATMLGLVGCDFDKYSEDDFKELARSFALSLMGDDVFAWNAYSVNPYESYGYVGSNDPSWYSYTGTRSSSEISMVSFLFDAYYSELKHYDISELSPVSAATYRTLENVTDAYRSYYKSKYASDFELLGGSYISSEGGYVADFASAFENFEFRNEKDVKALLKVTQTTYLAFKTYLDFANDRDKAGYPLYDYTITSMQDYLTDVYEKGDDYYLYEFADKKIDGADFLSQTKKDDYKTEYRAALKDKYMAGVKMLSDELNAYKGRVEKSDKSYLAAAGDAGAAYYEWLFRQKTGIKNANITGVYNELVEPHNSFLKKCNDITAEVDGLQETDKATYDEFYAYYNGEKFLLDITEPTAALEYLKTAAKNIVPDLKTEPEIGFKYMDDTVAQRTTSIAYYMRTPIDSDNSKEMITLNGYQAELDPSELLTTVAHEGYPGHLYAHVNAKESGTSLLSACMSNTAFSEGWANYTELVLLENIANDKASSKATALYCEYKRNRILSGYINMLLADIQINYFGYTADHYKGDDPDAEDYSDGTGIIEMLMEIPGVYIPYGYGMYTMYSIHEDVKTALGNDYNEVEFNGVLLGESFGPTLKRAKEIAAEYIADKKKQA